MRASPPKKAFLIVAHGSREERANQEVKQLGQALGKRAPGLTIHVAFLEFASPILSAAIDTLLEDGIQEIIVYPYFLGSGIHVSRDIPAILKKKQAEHPHLAIRQLPHLGADEDLLALLSKKASSL